MSDSEIEAFETPAFWVGVAGFSREQRELIQSSLHHLPGIADWRMCLFGEADAWLVNGAKCQVQPGGNLKVAPELPTEAALDLDLRAADRPVAFATPIADTNLEPHYTFDAASSVSVRRMLVKFDSGLRFARAQFALGAEIVERGAALRHGIFHVNCNGKLLAVLDFLHGEVALSAQLDPVEVQRAAWSKRSESARLLPPGFIASTPAKLAWNYVRRSDSNLLPPRYRSRTIYYRRPPRVPLWWLSDSQLRILSELACGCASFAELAARTGAVSPQLDRDVASLFYAGAITTTASKAAPPPAPQAYACPRPPTPAESEAPIQWRAELGPSATFTDGPRA